MTGRLIEESAATGLEQETECLSRSESDTSPTARPSRVGLALAGVILSAVLGGPGGTAIVEAGYTGRRRHERFAESDTSDERPDATLVNEARELFERGAAEFFEDGMQSAFAGALLKFLALHGHKGLQAIARYMLSGTAEPQVVSETLRWLGEMRDESSVGERWAIMQAMLNDPSPQIRDGAVLGFGLLDDPRARSLLQERYRVERVSELRRLIAQVVEQLDATSNAATTDRSSREPLV
jgi:hypothetical protein